MRRRRLLYLVGGVVSGVKWCVVRCLLFSRAYIELHNICGGTKARLWWYTVVWYGQFLILLTYLGRW